MTKTRDVVLLTLFRHENSNNSATTNARATSHISSGRSRLVDSRLKEANDSARNCLSYGPNALGARRAALRRWGTAWRCPTKLWEVVGMNLGSWEKKESGKKISSSRSTSVKSERFGAEGHELCVKPGRGWENGVALVKNCWAKSHETSEGGRGMRRELGERGNTENGAPSPEISQFSSYKTFLQGMADIFGCAEATATKRIPLERSRRVDPESRFARGMAGWQAGPDQDCLSRGLVDASTRATVRVVVSGGGGRGNESGSCGTHSDTSAHTYYSGLVNSRGVNERASAGGCGHESESEIEVDRESNL
ncbi:hypothetical protein BKA83DRAFT_4124705 [Pisolithus microcarpus]|nr:hypothetical protein BKA83DRAFT_4124705 [Pisolithus microcarpus]